MSRLCIGTRGSALARWQAERVAALLRERFPDLEIDIEVISTSGDRIRDRPLARAGGKGLFVKEIDEALLEGRVDVAVHSLKDVPAELVDGCRLGAVLERVEPRDALCFPDEARSGSLAGLPAGARIGTGSLRRRTQLLALRSDLEVVPMRGNVDTRLQKLDEGACHAVVLALAGLQRLGLADRPHHAFHPDEMVPAPGQGALCVEIRNDDEVVAGRVGLLEDVDVRAAVDAERAFLTAAGGSCSVPLGAHAVVQEESVDLRGLLGDAEGNTVRGSLQGDRVDADRVGSELARQLLERGGAELLARAQEAGQA